MIFIWRGLGWLALAFGAAALLAAIGIARSIDKNYPENIVGGGSMILAGGLVALFALLVLPALSRRRKLGLSFWGTQKMHTLFWIPMIWWSVIFVALGALWVLAGER